MAGVPNVFANATTSIPLSQLDQNFATTATLGNTAIGLGNTTTSVGNLTLANATLVASALGTPISGNLSSCTAFPSSSLTGNVSLTTQVTGTLPVANGGTGAASLTANNVILGNTTGAVQVVAPGTSGNVLTSTGTTWASQAAAAAGVSSLTAGNGITVSAATGAVTVSMDIYTGSSVSNATYPIGSYVLTAGATSYNLNSSQDVRTSGSTTFNIGSGTALTGTWRCRGTQSVAVGGCVGTIYVNLFQRTA